MDNQLEQVSLAEGPSPYDPCRITPPSSHQPEASSSHSPPDESRLLPFLELKPRLLLTAFSPGLLPMVFTIGHLLANRSSTQALADRLRQNVLDACASLAGGASALTALPRYLAMQTNRELIRSARATVLGVGMGLIYAIMIIETVLIFIINAYRSLLLCTIELVVNAALDLLIAAVQVFTDGVQAAAELLQVVINSSVGAVDTVANGVGGLINTITGQDTVDKVDLAGPVREAIGVLENIDIPFERQLQELNQTMPTLSELQDKMNEVISIPFQLLIKEINETRLEIAQSLDEKSLPVPSLKTLSADGAASLNQSLCADLDTAFIDDTAAGLYKLASVAIGLLIALVIVGYAILVFIQWRQWRSLQDTVHSIEDNWSTLPPGTAPSAWTVVAVVENPMLETTMGWTNSVLGRFGVTPSQRTQTNLRWLFSYLCHPTCLTLLIMSVLGLIVLLIQIAALGALKRAAQLEFADSMSATTDDLTARLNSLAWIESSAYAKDANVALTKLESQINSDMFGNFVNTTAVTLNTTINEFYDEIERGIASAFGDTPLYSSINTFVYCILGSKVDALSKGLTWLSENAQIALPGVPDNILQLNNETMAELAQPLTAAAAGDGTEDSGAIAQLAKHFQKALEAEIMIYCILLSVYGFLFFIGVGVVIWHSGLSDKYYAWRGMEPRPPSVMDEKAGYDDSQMVAREAGSSSGGGALAKLRGIFSRPERVEPAGGIYGDEAAYGEEPQPKEKSGFMASLSSKFGRLGASPADGNESGWGSNPPMQEQVARQRAFDAEFAEPGTAGLSRYPAAGAGPNPYASAMDNPFADNDPFADDKRSDDDGGYVAGRAPAGRLSMAEGAERGQGHRRPERPARPTTEEWSPRMLSELTSPDDESVDSKHAWGVLEKLKNASSDKSVRV